MSTNKQRFYSRLQIPAHFSTNTPGRLAFVVLNNRTSKLFFDWARSSPTAFSAQVLDKSLTIDMWDLRWGPTREESDSNGLR